MSIPKTSYDFEDLAKCLTLAHTIIAQLETQEGEYLLIEIRNIISLWSQLFHEEFTLEDTTYLCQHMPEFDGQGDTTLFLAKVLFDILSGKQTKH